MESRRCIDTRQNFMSDLAVLLKHIQICAIQRHEFTSDFGCVVSRQQNFLREFMRVDNTHIFKFSRNIFLAPFEQKKKIFRDLRFSTIFYDFLRFSTIFYDVQKNFKFSITWMLAVLLRVINDFVY